MKTTLAVALLWLTGCASYSEMQARVPSLDLVTTKAPLAYAGCVAPKFMEIWPGQVSVIPDGESTVIAVAAPNGGAMVATVTVDPAGRVTLREMSHVNLGSAFNRARQHTRDCI